MAEKEKPVDLLDKGAAIAGLKQMQGVSPRSESSSEQSEGIVIKGLGQDKYIEETFLIINGYLFDPLTRTWTQYRGPVLNKKGIGNFMKCLHTLKRIDFSNFDPKDIPLLVYKFYKTNYIQFMCYHEEFGLAEEDYNIIKTELMFNALGSFNNAKNAGHRNVVRGTMSENVFMKALGLSNHSEGGNNNKLFGLIPKFWKKDGQN